MTDSAASDKPGGEVTDLHTPEGFKRMYREQLGYVLATVDRLGVPATQREDVCHDVFLKAFDKRADYDPARPLRPWLFGIAFRLSLNLRRKRSPSGDDAGLAGLPDPREGPFEHAAAQQGKSVLMRAVERLEPERKAVFLLCDLEGHPAPEVARVLEIPLNTAYSRLRLARQELLAATASLREGAAR